MKKRGKTNFLRNKFDQKGKNRKAQFYLIGAIIIVMVTLSLASIKDYAITKKEPVKFYDLSDELKEESARVVDYGIYNEKYIIGGISKKIEDFTENYFINYTEEKEKDTEFVFVYGNKKTTTIATYTIGERGTINIVGFVGKTSTITIKRRIPTKQTFQSQDTDDLKVKILEKEYDFKLKKGENFLFAIVKNTTEEKYIVMNE